MKQQFDRIKYPLLSSLTVATIFGLALFAGWTINQAWLGSGRVALPTPTPTTAPTAVPTALPTHTAAPSPTTAPATPTAQPTTPTSPTPPSPTASPATPSGFVHVVSVVDGDTFKVEIDQTVKTVRIVGVNTPETVDPRKPVECMGKEASAFSKATLTGALVRLERDPTQANTDRYGRLLRFVFLQDGTDFGKLLLTNGYAQEAMYSTKPYQYRQQYLAAQAQAKQLKKGLWDERVCPTHPQ